MRAFNPEELTKGTYLIMGNVVHGGNNLLTVLRGNRIQLVIIPTDLMPPPQIMETRQQVLEIKEGAGYRIPVSRPVLNQEELDAIQKYTPPGGSTRRR